MFISGKKLCILLPAIGSVLAAAKDECKFVNSLIGEDESYDCCNYGILNIKCSADHITYINLSNKNIERTMPESFGNLPNLTVLNLSNNKISGSLPNDFSTLESLVELNISNNQISNIPEGIEELTSLKILDASSNQLTTFQKKITELPLLTDLNLSDNQIKDEIPSCIGNLVNLRVLNLEGNNFSGAIPGTIGRIEKLVTLNLANNILEESVPSILGVLTNLRYINLSHNNLSGKFPTSEFEGLRNIAEISLDNNFLLYGKIPDIRYDASEYICNFKDTNLCYDDNKNSKCEYTDYSCSRCAENALLVDDMCVCDSNYSGVGYILCSDGKDSNLNNGSESGCTSRVSFQSLTIASLIIFISYLLM